MHKKFLEAMAAFQELLRTHDKALNGLSNIPDSIKNELKQLTDSINLALKELPPLMQVPAALDAAQALEWASNAYARMQDYMQRLSGLNTALVTRNSELNADLTTKFIAKTEHAALVETARKESEKAGRDALMPMITAMRKQSIELAKLPMPEEAVLALDAEGFKDRFETAVKTVESCGKRGLDLAHATTLTAAWLPKDKVICKFSELDALGYKEKEAEAKPGKELAADPLRGTGKTGETAPELAGCVI